jgi:hypothetical protein
VVTLVPVHVESGRRGVVELAFGNIAKARMILERAQLDAGGLLFIRRILTVF